MDNQHKHIKGYRDLSQVEIDLMNEIKSKAEEVGVLVAKVQSLATAADNKDAEVRTDGRWASIARTDLQTGFMALVRSIAQPTTF